MPLRLTLSSLRRAEGRIANRLNSAALNSVIVCSEPTCLRLASRSHPRPSVPTAPCAAWQSSAAYTAGNRSHRAGNQSELPGGGFIDFVSKDSVAWPIQDFGEFVVAHSTESSRTPPSRKPALVLGLYKFSLRAENAKG